MPVNVQSLKTEDRAYSAGFLDGDGSIFARIVYRKDYRLKFQIQIVINFTQKISKYWFLIWLHSTIGCGVLRDRGDGCGELAITGHDKVKPLLEMLTPYLRIKKEAAGLALRVIKSLEKKQSAKSFLESCKLADEIANINDSKNRTITSKTVEETLNSL